MRYIAREDRVRPEKLEALKNWQSQSQAGKQAQAQR